MSRLVAFGCSHTFGYALPDTTTTSKNPSNFSWPALLSKELGMELINKGLNGISNHRILYELLTTDLQESDTVVIFWTATERGVVINNDGNMLNIGAWDSDIITKSYFIAHSDLDLASGTLLDIHHADLFCRKNGIIPKHFLLIDKDRHYIEAAKKQHPWADTHFEYLNLIKIKRDYASDNLHYGVETHKEISNYIKTFLI